MNRKLTDKNLESLKVIRPKDIRNVKKVCCLWYRKDRNCFRTITFTHRFNDQARARIAGSIQAIAKRLLPED